jgi:hypothetical protein
MGTILSSAETDHVTVTRLQFRDITPNDYDLLGELTETNAATVEADTLQLFPTAIVDFGSATAHDKDGNVIALSEPHCAVCLLEWEVEDEVRVLPCGHPFHAECIDTWLTGSSEVC